MVFGSSATGGTPLVTFNSNAPGTILSSVGLARSYGSLDFHPFTGELFGVDTASATGSFIYRIDPTTGAETSLSLTGDILSLENTGVTGMAFDPVTGFLRLTESNSQVNYLVNILGNSAAVTRQTDFSFAPGDPNFGQAIRVDSMAFSSNQILYGIDSGLNILVSINPQADGLVNTIGSIGIPGFNLYGFDITEDNRGFFTVDNNITSQFYSLDLATGSSTLIGDIGSSNIRGMAILAVPEPSSLGLTILAGVLAFARYRRRSQSAIG